MKSRLIIGLLFTASFQALASPARLIFALKKIATRAHIAKLATGTFSSATATDATLHQKKQHEAQLKQDAYNADIITIFAHGMKSSAKAGLHRHINSQRPGAFIQGPLATFDFKDTHKASLATLGQEEDVKQLEEACLAFGDQRKVLVGSSRGASTCINYLGSRQPAHIGAAVVESPFASIETMITPALKPLLRWWFPHYKPEGLQPMTSAPKITKETPLFIFCSKDDEIIPVNQTIDLYKELRKSGHEKTHLLIVDHGAHAKILIDKNGQLVRNTIHAFYKKYNIPHNDSWASEGEPTFNACQPSSETLATIGANTKSSSWKTLIRLSGGSSGSR